jgi:hypothetical protein
MLQRALDPDSARASPATPELELTTFSGDPFDVGAPLDAPPDPETAVRRIVAFLTRWLEGERAASKAGRPLELDAAGSALDVWSSLTATTRHLFMGIERPGGEVGAAAQALNTAALSMAFANDLGLPRTTLREVAELAVMMSLAEAAEAPPGEGRAAHAAALALTHRLNRLGTVLAVAAAETELLPDKASVSVVASIHVLCSTYEALTNGRAQASGPALDAMNGRLRSRFHPELLGFFTQWVTAQAAK